MTESNRPPTGLHLPPCSRRAVLGGGFSLALMPFLPGLRLRAPFDLVIRGASVLDGTGTPAFEADVGIRGDAIAAVERLGALADVPALDARGLCLAPGFLDMHSHSDGSVLRYRDNESRVLQGCTTEIAGNCGGSIAADGSMTVAQYFERLEREPVSTNQALLIGLGTLLDAVGIRGAEPRTTEQRRRMTALFEEALEQGAVGLSSGLEYAPQRFSSTDEVVELARLAGRAGGFYATHMRDELSALLAAVDEALDIGRRSGARVQISHLKAVGAPNWRLQDASLHLLEGARREGVDALADCYPYTAYNSTLKILLPDEIVEGGDRAMLERLRDPAIRTDLIERLPGLVRNDPGAYELIVVTSIGRGAHPELRGLDLATIAQRWELSNEEALLKLLEDAGGSVGFIGHAMSLENVQRVLSHPLVMVGSDGSALPVLKGDEQGGEARYAHPRSAGTFARILGPAVRDWKLFDLPTAVAKMSSMPADQAGLADRGRIAPGKRADLVLFDPATVTDGATFESPLRGPMGIPHVFVNGVQVVKDGAHTGAHPGRPLRRA